jgi:hypothetical protein
MWRAVPEDCLDFKPHEKTNTIRTILIHQILSERRFFAEFVGTREPPVEGLLPPGDKPCVQSYIDKYLWLAKLRLPQLAAGIEQWWLTPMPFFGGLQRERIWTFWRRVLHTCHGGFGNGSDLRSEIDRKTPTKKDTPMSVPLI